MRKTDFIFNVNQYRPDSRPPSSPTPIFAAIVRGYIFLGILCDGKEFRADDSTWYCSAGATRPKAQGTMRHWIRPEYGMVPGAPGDRMGKAGVGEPSVAFNADTPAPFASEEATLEI